MVVRAQHVSISHLTHGLSDRYQVVKLEGILQLFFVTGDKFCCVLMVYERYCRYMKKSIFGAIALMLPFEALAHTRWFAEGEVTPFVTSEPTVFYMSMWVAVMVIVIAVGAVLHDRNMLRLAFLRPKAVHAYERAASTFTMIVGAFFLIAGTHEYLFSPNMTVEAGVPFVLIVIQILIGITFLLGIGTRISALLLAGIWVSTFYFTGWVSALENIWVLSTAGFVAVMGNDYFSLVGFSALRKHFEPYKSCGLSFLRLGTGATLVVLGLSEKILAPELGINFLVQHDWNFMQMLGFNFSDYLFVLSAGSVEMLFGLVFILGIVTRLNALVVAAVFTTPLFLLGPIELAGHLPHFAAVVLLLLFGSGDHFMFFKRYDDARWGE